MNCNTFYFEKNFRFSGVHLSSGVCLGTINNKPTFTLTCLNRDVFSAVFKGENISNIWGLHALREYASWKVLVLGRVEKNAEKNA